MEYHLKYMVYSKKQHIFLVVYEFGGGTNEVVLYLENIDTPTANSKCSTVKGLPVFGTPFFPLLFLIIILIFHICNQVIFKISVHVFSRSRCCIYWSQ